MRLPNLFKPFPFFTPSTATTSSPAVPSLMPDLPLILPTRLKARDPRLGAPFGLVIDDRRLLLLVLSRKGELLAVNGTLGGRRSDDISTGLGPIRRGGRM